MTISDLANEARVARGTLYRIVDSVEDLYARVVQTTSIELHAQVAETLDDSGITDPAARLATGIRVIVRTAHENPAMARFLVRFALSEQSLHAVFTGPPMRDVQEGIDTGRYSVDSALLISTGGLLAGASISALQLVLDGHLGWRNAGTQTAELVLRALGVPAADAHGLATTALPLQSNPNS